MKRIIFLILGISVAIGITAFISISNKKETADKANKNLKNLKKNDLKNDKKK